MKIIEELRKQIEEEIADASNYAEKAAEYKNTYPEAAALYHRLSEEEITHMNALHKEAVRLIEECLRNNE